MRSTSAGFQARDDMAARIGFASQMDSITLRDLVDLAAVGRAPVAPLVAVHRAELAVLVGPFVPDGDAALLQPLHVGVAAQEPEQLVDDRLQVQLLGGEQREAVGEVEAQLAAEHRQRAGAGAVGLARAALAAPRRGDRGTAARSRSSSYRDPRRTARARSGSGPRASWRAAGRGSAGSRRAAPASCGIGALTCMRIRSAGVRRCRRSWCR